ncbi:MAG: AAA family ATPase [Methanomassiliicoccales archaeon]|jgi:predicted kinase
MNAKLTLMCGFPRCGKSTWIAKNKVDAIVVCLDVIRKHIFGHQFHREAEPFVMAVAKSMVRMLLDQDKHVIVDATNLVPVFRKEWYAIAREYGAAIEIVWVKTPIHVCLGRNKASSRGEKLPVKVLKSMIDRFVSPSYDSEGELNINIREII